MQKAAPAHADEMRIERDLKGDMVTTLRSCGPLNVRAKP
jgi:hypothetical protein